jgi:hypothetical protein
VSHLRFSGVQLGQLAIDSAIEFAKHLLPHDLPDRDARAVLIAAALKRHPVQ